MSDLQSTFQRTRHLRQVERRLLMALSAQRGALTPTERNLVGYAFAFARLERMPGDHGDVDLFELVAPFRHWWMEQLDLFVHERRVDWSGLRNLLPLLATRLDEARRHLVEHESSQISSEQLDDELCVRRLVMVLGGGGGAGYSHLGAFSVVSELGYTPSLLVGSSMGAMLGVFRAVEREYDPLTTAMALPRPTEVARVFSPYRGFSRFGFPGTVELKARTVGTQIFREMLGRPVPRLSDLAIPLRTLATGLRTGIGLAIGEIEAEIAKASRSFSPLALRRRVALFTRVVRSMVSKPRFLEEIVFGSGELRDVSAIDAMGFSCAVPGVIHYDLYSERDETIDVLQRVFAEHRLFRLTDGGVVNNVASRVAWETVARGEIGTRNTFILAFDAFAPQLNMNAPFLPVQQIVRRAVLANREYSDYHISYKRPPSPIQVLQSFDGLQDVIARTREELEPHRAFLRLALAPLPRWPRPLDDWRQGT